MVASFWMPHVLGCSNTVVVPAESLDQTIAEEGGLEAFNLFWPYLIGLSTAVAVLLCAVFAWKFADRLLLGLQFFWYICICLGLWSSVLTNQVNRVFLIFMEQLPVHVCVFWWCGRAVARRDWATAWARLSTIMMALAILRLYLTYVFARAHYYGFYVAIAGIVGMFLGPWFFRVRWERVLVSIDANKRPLQFRVIELLIAITLFALGYGYYRYLPELLGDG